MSEIARPEDVRLSADEMAATKFLIRYKEPTRTGYQLSIKQWFQFCADHNVRPLEAERAYVELWMRSMEQRGLMASTINGKLNPVVGFYRLAKIDRLIVDDPTEHLRRPSVPQESRRQGLTRAEGMACLEAAQAAGPLEHALWCVMLLLGPRVGEVCRLNVRETSARSRASRRSTWTGRRATARRTCRWCPARRGRSRCTSALARRGRCSSSRASRCGSTGRRRTGS
jgi:site-specific recombinase XerD